MRLAHDVINDEFIEARSKSRIHFEQGESNRLPSLSGNGMHVAAAITCLSELDIQVIRHVALLGLSPTVATESSSSSSFSSDPSLSLPLAQHPKFRTYVRMIESGEVYPVSIFTKFRYIDYFLPPHTKLHTVLESTPAGGSAHGRGGSHQGSGSGGAAGGAGMTRDISKDFDFFLCNPVVRLAAYEGFARVSFALHVSHMERKEKKLDIERKRAMYGGGGGQTNAQSALPMGAAAESRRMIPSTIEAMEILCKNVSNAWIHQQCAMIFMDAVMDRPPRVAMEAISLGHSFYAIGAKDRMALTLSHRPQFIHYLPDGSGFKVDFSHKNPHVVDIKKADDKFMKLCLSSMNRIITKTPYNQVSSHLM
jgi:hypothetical protein